MPVSEYVKPEHLQVTDWVTHWVALPVLLIEGPDSWQDVMVRPAQDTNVEGFTVEVATVAVNLQCGEEIEECKIPEGAERLIRPASMSVVTGGRFTNAEAVEHARACMIAAGIPVEELVEVEPEEFFSF